MSTTSHPSRSPASVAASSPSTVTHGQYVDAVAGQQLVHLVVGQLGPRRRLTQHLADEGARASRGDVGVVLDLALGLAGPGGVGHDSGQRAHG
ncbi:MAG: hypothetical protein WKF83_04105 [Nocardioidaceae bacterium]